MRSLGFGSCGVVGKHRGPSFLSFSTDFAGTPTADISTISGITRIDGTANDMTISAANACNANSVDASGTFYQFPTVGSLQQRVQFTVSSAATAAGAAVCVRGQDRDNWVGVRWSTTTFTIAQRVAGGTVTVIGTSAGVTPTTGQVCIIEVTTAGNVRLVVSGTERIAPVAVDVTLTDLHTGMLSRAVVKTPFVDDVTSSAF